MSSPSPRRGSDGLSDARRLLAELFGHDEFRPGQSAAIEASLAGRDALVLLPTGTGKSVCYQIPARLHHRSGRGTTVVVSPLIALMHDQVASLRSRGFAAESLHSQQEEAEARQIEQRWRRGELELIYVSPERSTRESFRRLLGETRVASIAIDEAHCLSQWGHDFRPDYLRLVELREGISAPILALTATAPPRVAEEIVAGLGLRDPLRVDTGFERPNLRFEVRLDRDETARVEELLLMLDELGLRGRARRGERPGRALIYCSTRDTTKALARSLSARGVPAGHYHAGRTALARQRAQRSFELGRTRVLVATSAFGMGVDLPDVRLLVHHQTPGSLEAYAQEAGRAGRDGGASRCVLYFSDEDLQVQRSLGERGDGSAHQGQRLREMEAYALGPHCRHQALAHHFSSRTDHPECGHCDHCRPEPIPARRSPGIPSADVPATTTPLTTQATAPRTRPPRKPATERHDEAELLRSLDNLRRFLARRRRCAPAKLLSARSLRALAQRRPRSPRALAAIPGLERSRDEELSRRILDLMDQHRRRSR